jgi:hypothetical protein
MSNNKLGKNFASDSKIPISVDESHVIIILNKKKIVDDLYNDLIEKLKVFNHNEYEE